MSGRTCVEHIAEKAIQNLSERTVVVLVLDHCPVPCLAGLDTPCCQLIAAGRDLNGDWFRTPATTVWMISPPGSQRLSTCRSNDWPERVDDEKRP